MINESLKSALNIKTCSRQLSLLQYAKIAYIGASSSAKNLFRQLIFKIKHERDISQKILAMFVRENTMAVKVHCCGLNDKLSHIN